LKEKPLKDELHQIRGTEATKALSEGRGGGPRGLSDIFRREKKEEASGRTFNKKGGGREHQLPRKEVFKSRRQSA